MLEVHQFPCLSDNYGYLLHDPASGETACIDTPDAEAYLRKKGYSFPAAWLSPELLKVYRKPEGLPVTVVRGKDGRVAQAEKGQLFPEDVANLARWL